MSESRRPISRRARHWVPLPLALFAVVGSMLQLFDVETGWEDLRIWTQTVLSLTISLLVLNLVLDRPAEGGPAGTD